MPFLSKKAETIREKTIKGSNGHFRVAVFSSKTLALEVRMPYLLKME